MTQLDTYIDTMLGRSRDLVLQGFVKNHNALDADGEPCSAMQPQARSFSGAGAVQRSFFELLRENPGEADLLSAARQIVDHLLNYKARRLLPRNCSHRNAGPHPYVVWCGFYGDAQAVADLYEELRGEFQNLLETPTGPRPAPAQP